MHGIFSCDSFKFIGKFPSEKQTSEGIAIGLQNNRKIGKHILRDSKKGFSKHDKLLFKFFQLTVKNFANK